MESENQSARREFVRCGCGVLRGSSEDPLLQVPAMVAAVLAEVVDEIYGTEPAHLPFENYQAPRICRGCGAVYMLPRQVEPSSAH